MLPLLVPLLWCYPSPEPSCAYLLYCLFSLLKVIWRLCVCVFPSNRVSRLLSFTYFGSLYSLSKHLHIVWLLKGLSGGDLSLYSFAIISFVHNQWGVERGRLIGIGVVNFQRLLQDLLLWFDYVWHSLKSSINFDWSIQTFYNVMVHITQLQFLIQEGLRLCYCT